MGKVRVTDTGTRISANKPAKEIGLGSPNVGITLVIEDKNLYG